MNEPKIYTLSEAARKAGVPESALKEWVDGKAVVPSITADGSAQCFDEDDLVNLQQVKHLADAGYGVAEIRKIVKKVGLPRPEKLRRKERKRQRYLTVGELAERSGVGARTIKHWEERGIFTPTTRTEGGHRLYDEGFVRFCRLVQDLQLFGYSLDEIKRLADRYRTLTAWNEEKAPAGGEARDELTSIQDEIAGIRSRIGALTEGIERWRRLLKETDGQVAALNKRTARGPKETAARAPAKGASSS